MNGLIYESKDTLKSFRVFYRLYHLINDSAHIKLYINRDMSNEICFSIVTFRGMNKSKICLILSEFEWFYTTLSFRYNDIHDKLYINR